MYKKILSTVLASSIAFAMGCKTSPEPATSAAITPAEAQQLAKEAYIYAYAPVYMERQRRNMISADSDMGDGRAPLNTFSKVRALGTPDLKTIVMPNNDTFYSSAWIDLSKGPYLLEVPDMGKRYFTFQMMDVFSNTFDYVGTRATGSKGGKFVIAEQGWKGIVPEGVTKTIFTPTSTIWIAARFGEKGATDLDGAHKAQDSVRFTPLDGNSFVATNPKFAPLPPPEKFSTDQFFTMFGDVLKAYPTPQPAQAMVTRFGAIGLDSKSGYDPSHLSPEILTAIDHGAKDGFASIEAAKLGENANGWDFSMKNGRFGEDYLVRSAVAFRSLAGNAPEEAIYFNANVDFTGKPLDGKYKYIMKFEKGQLPPVNAFWSLTMYDGKTYFMVENPIKRYSIGSQTPGLKTAPDGSVTLLIQHDSPGKALESNWLPAPAGSFDVHLRTYVPQKPLLDGEFKLPPLTHVD
jgi:hypothetical protein